MSIFFDGSLDEENSFLKALKMTEDKTEYSPSKSKPKKKANFGKYP